MPLQATETINPKNILIIVKPVWFPIKKKKKKNPPKDNKTKITTKINDKIQIYFFWFM